MKSSSDSSQRPGAAVYGALLAVQLFFGINYYTSKVILAEIPARAWMSLRITAAAVILVVVHTAFIRRYPTWKDLGKLAVCALFGVLLNQLLFIEGLARTTPSHSAIVSTMTPIIALAMSVALGLERLHPLKIVGFATAVGGVWWLLGIGSFHFDPTQRTGDLLSLGGCVVYATFLVSSRTVAGKYDTITSTMVLMVVGGLALDVVCAPQLGAFVTEGFHRVSPKIWAFVVYVVVFPTVVTYWLNYWALKNADASLVALFIYIQPVVATGLSVALLGEPITPKMIGSAGLIFLGVLVTSPPVRQWFDRLKSNGALTPDPLETSRSA